MGLKIFRFQSRISIWTSSNLTLATKSFQNVCQFRPMDVPGLNAVTNIKFSPVICHVILLHRHYNSQLNYIFLFGSLFGFFFRLLTYNQLQLINLVLTAYPVALTLHFLIVFVVRWCPHTAHLQIKWSFARFWSFFLPLYTVYLKKLTLTHSPKGNLQKEHPSRCLYKAYINRNQ